MLALQVKFEAFWVLKLWFLNNVILSIITNGLKMTLTLYKNLHFLYIIT